MIAEKLQQNILHEKVPFYVILRALFAKEPI